MSSSYPAGQSAVVARRSPADAPKRANPDGRVHDAVSPDAKRFCARCALDELKTLVGVRSGTAWWRARLPSPHRPPRRFRSTPTPRADRCGHQAGGRHARTCRSWRLPRCAAECASAVSRSRAERRDPRRRCRTGGPARRCRPRYSTARRRFPEPLRRGHRRAIDDVGLAERVNVLEARSRLEAEETRRHRFARSSSRRPRARRPVR